jgi:spore coat protein CotF
MKTELTDRDAIADLLAITKTLSAAYDLAAKEAANASLRQRFLTHWREVQDLHARIFHEMHRRGWYVTRTAGQQAIRQAIDRWEKREHKEPALAGGRERGS